MGADDVRSGIEADLFEAARRWHLARSPRLIWILVLVALGLSVASLVQAETTAQPSQAMEVAMLATAVAVTVALISAGTLALHGSRDTRWDAPVTVGLGSVVLGVSTFEQVLSASAAAHDVEPFAGIGHALGFFRWVGLCLVVGGLVWRSETGWSERTRTALVAFTVAAPLAAVTGWDHGGYGFTTTERVVLGAVTLMLVVASLRLLRRDTSTPLFEGGTVLGVGLALAIILDVASVSAGDVASVAALAWLLIAGLLTAAWFEHQAAMGVQTHRSQTERYLRLIEDSRQTIERALSDRSVLRHNSTSSLIAIEGGLDALGDSIEHGDLTAHERMTRALAAEIGRLRRMLAAVDTNQGAPQTSLVDAVDSVVHLARSRGQLIAVHVPEHLAVAARPDAVAEILHNLLDNAAMHAPGSLVAIEASAMGDGYVDVVVQDDGPGVRPDLVGRVFDKGVSRRKGPGTGLGLYSARQLAVEAGGELALLPVPDGAAFRLVLPAAAPAVVVDLRVVADQPTDELAGGTAP